MNTQIRQRKRKPKPLAPVREGREIVKIVTRKGQVTIPAQLRRLLNIEEGDKVVFALEGSAIKVSRKTSVVRRTAGAIKSDLPNLSAEQLREAAEQAIAEEVTARA